MAGKVDVAGGGPVAHAIGGEAVQPATPSSPSSVGGVGPAMANGVNPDDLVACTYTSGPNQGGLVATFNGAGIEFPVATEAHSLSSVKALFQ